MIELIEIIIELIILMILYSVNTFLTSKIFNNKIFLPNKLFLSHSLRSCHLDKHIFIFGEIYYTSS